MTERSWYTSIKKVLRQFQSVQVACISQVPWNVSGQLIPTQIPGDIKIQVYMVS